MYPAVYRAAFIRGCYEIIYIYCHLDKKIPDERGRGICWTVCVFPDFVVFPVLDVFVYAA
jgi:hypothetical protein